MREAGGAGLGGKGLRGFTPLPHVYPFRFADRVEEKTGPGSGRVRALISVNGRRAEGGIVPPLTLVELLAQAALLLEGGDAEIGRSGFLAGLSDFRVEKVPAAGDRVTVEVRIAGRLGPVVKFEGEVYDETGRRLARGSFTVRKGTAPPPGAA